MQELEDEEMRLRNEREASDSSGSLDEESDIEHREIIESSSDEH